MSARDRGRRGSVLILVLWTLSMFTVYAVSLGVGARARAALLSRTETLAALELAAYSGVESAKAAVFADPTIDMDASSDPWANAPALFFEIPVGAATFTVGRPGKAGGAFVAGVVDEQSKINLNKADAKVIAALFLAAGVEEDLAEELSYNVVDWRDQDSNFGHPKLGAENDYYEDLKRPYPCKNAPMQSLDELFLIKGINREIFDKIVPFVTLHGGGSVNVNTATRESLIALGLPERTTDKLLAYRSGTDEKLGTADDAAFAQTQVIVDALDRAYALDDEERGRLSDLILSERLTTVSEFFSAHSVAVARSGARIEVDAVFDREGRLYSVRSSGVQWPSRG